jgi:hypothetical protein
MKLILMICCAFLLSTASATAQTQIKGKVKDKAGKPIQLANVTLKDAEDNIIKFAQTNKNGEYSLMLDGNAKGGSIEATCIGYKKASVLLTDTNTDYDLVLEESEIQLKEVKIKKTPSLTVNGDTLSYRPADFVGKQDRSIGDVLRKMPGIDIADDGKITYNGKIISNLYIDKDNLLDDRYNIATRSIPYDAVDQVQVIQKDQPIKMLQKNNASDDVALNLVINDKFKLYVVGVNTTGIGTPDRWEEDGTAILLSNKVKFINNITGDNIGIDPGTDIISHNSPFAGNYLLSTNAAATPPLPQNRYLSNNAGLINLNNLVNINKDLQLKSNIAYLYDQQRQQSGQLLENFLPGQTVSYSEIQNNKINPQILRAQFDLTENASDLYYKDVFLLDYRPLTTLSAFINNNVPANQVLKQQTLGISNVLDYKLKIESGDMINLTSVLSSTDKPESLFITPGIDSAIFNNNVPYAYLKQYVKLPAWYASTNASMSFITGNFTQNYNAGFDWQRQYLKTGLDRLQNNQLTELVSPGAVNNLNWLKTKFYTGGNYSFVNSNITATLNLPLSINNFSYHDAATALNQSLQKLFFDPVFNFSYFADAQNKVSVNYSLVNTPGIITNVYNGEILQNYQSLVANNAPLSATQTQTVGAVYEFKKATQLLFMNLAATYSDMAANDIQSTVFSNLLQQQVVLPLPNHNRSLSLNANASKYIFGLAITVGGGIGYRQNWLNLLENNELFPARVQTFTYKASLNGRLVSFINWIYNANYAVSNSKTQSAPTSSNSQLAQKTTLSFTTVKNIYFNVSGDYLYTRQPGREDLKYLFADMNVNWRLLKLKTDIMLSVTNIANVKTFIAVNLTANSLTTGTYTIPGRVALLKGTFSF